jgi:hypothetical protein
MSKVWMAYGLMPGEETETSAERCFDRALTYLSQRDQSKLLKKKREQINDNDQIMHTLRELLAGAFMAQQGHALLYEPNIDGLTPDWQFQREGECEFIADVVNFHIDCAIEDRQTRVLDDRGVWCGWMPDVTLRLYETIQKKASKYKNLAEKRRLPYIVIVFPWLSAGVFPAEVERCILPSDGLFNDYPTLSGVYHMYEKGNCKIDSNAGYRFDYYANAKASYLGNCLANGSLTYRFPARV